MSTAQPRHKPLCHRSLYPYPRASSLARCSVAEDQLTFPTPPSQKNWERVELEATYLCIVSPVTPPRLPNSLSSIQRPFLIPRLNRPLKAALVTPIAVPIPVQILTFARLPVVSMLQRAAVADQMLRPCFRVSGEAVVPLEIRSRDTTCGAAG